MKLIPNWKDGAKMISAWCLLLVAFVEGGWFALSPDSQAIVTGVVPEHIVHGLTFAIGVVGFIGRFIDQGLSSAKTD